MLTSLFLRHSSGATHELRGRRLKALVKDLNGQECQAAIVKLMEAGYTGFISIHPDHADYHGDVDITELCTKYISGAE